MTILLLTAQDAERDNMIGTLTAPGHVVVVAGDLAQAADHLAVGNVELVVLDLAAPDALRFLEQNGGHRSNAPVVCLADRREPSASAEALRHGVADIIDRPLRRDSALAALANAKEMLRVACTPAPVAPPEQGDGLIGVSPAIRDVLDVVRRVSRSRCGLLIVGERGSGRETVAREVHAQGPHHHHPFVKIVCADLCSTEFDDRFNTGAAPGTTVYLEGLEDLPPDLQARVESRVRSSDVLADGEGVRYIASVQPAVDDAISRGAIRATLVDAVGVVRIALPPLRQRAEDVPLLATHFLREACRRARIPAKVFSRSALTLLAALPWPGNAGELRSLTERLVVLIPRGVVLLEDVLAHVRLDGSAAQVRARGPLKDARDQFERGYVTAVLQHHHGRMNLAARELGIERTNLYRKIKQLNIRWNAN